jgi:hypothetical protein
MAAFLVIKWVHGQGDNHPILFMMLGMVSALIYKLRNGTPETETASSAERRALQKRAMRVAPVSRSPSYGLDPRQMAD